MLPKNKRLSIKNFEMTFRRGKRVYAGGFLYVVRPSRDVSRFAVVVGKKTTPSAVQRNRIRRQLYEIIRRGFSELSRPHNVILLYKGPEIFKNAEDFKKSLSFLKQKIS